MSTDFSPERLESLVLSGQVNIVRTHLGATAAAEAAYAKWRTEHAAWVTSNRVDPEGSCNEHEFSNKGLKVGDANL